MQSVRMEGMLEIKLKHGGNKVSYLSTISFILNVFVLRFKDNWILIISAADTDRALLSL